jgi:hypothetical protein
MHLITLNDICIVYHNEGSSWSEVFGNKILRRIFGLEREEVIRSRRKVHSEELRNIYSLPIIISNVKSRRMRWAEHEEQMRRRMYVRFL